MNTQTKLYRIYSKLDCPYCEKAKQLFERKGVSYEELVVGEDISREEYLNIIPGFTTVPGIWYQGIFIGGYSELQSFLPD
jgi:glutaredoxin